MPFHGSIVVIKRSGFDGSVFPLVNGDCLMGRAEGCDIRVQLPTVSEEHCRIETNENDEARLVCLSENVGQTQLNGKNVKTGSSEMLYHKAVFTVGDRSFRWEYPQDSVHVLRKPQETPKSAKKSPKPKVLTPNNSQVKDSITKSSHEAKSVASKAIEAAIKGVIPSPKQLKTPKQPVIEHVSSSKRVSFGPYVSPEIIDKTLPPSTPVKRGAEPLNLSLDSNSSKTMNSPKIIAGNATPRTVDTPSALIKRNLKKKISKHPENESITEETKPGVLKRNPNDTPMIKDNSGYRASPRRIDALVGTVPKIRRSSIEQNLSVKTNAKLTQRTPTVKQSSPEKTHNAISKLTKSTVKIRPTKSFYGTKAAQTPKGAKRKASLGNDTIQSAKKARTSSPANMKTPEKSKAKSRTLKVTKSTVKIKQSQTFYGARAAKTPKGAKPQKRLASPIQRVAKKTKMSTPQARLKPTSHKQEKANTPKGATPSKAPGSAKVNRKPMWSEIVKKAVPTKANQAQRVLKRVKKTSKVKTPLQQGASNKRSRLTTGHAKSPETIIIKRKAKAKTPTVLSKVGRKTPSKVKATPARKAPLSSKQSAKKSNAVPMSAKPSKVPPPRTPRAMVSPNSSLKSSLKVNKLKTPTSTSVKTPKSKASPNPAKSTPSRTPKNLKYTTPKSKSLSDSSQAEHSASFNDTAFDFDSIKTPAIPLEMFVSPLTSKKKLSKRISQGKSPSTGGIKQMLAASKVVKTPDMRGIRKMMLSPKPQKTPKMGGMKQMLATPKDIKTPDMRGIRKMMISPKSQKTPKMGGMKQMLATPKDIKTPDMRGIRKMMISPKIQKTPRMAGIKEMFASPKTARTPDMRGIKSMMASPKSQKTPRFGGMKQMLTTPKEAKTPDMRGMKQMLKTPKDSKSPRLAGIKQMYITPKESKSPRLGGLKKMFATPKQPVTPSFEGLAALVKTPTPQKRSPIKQGLDGSASKPTNMRRSGSFTKILSPKDVKSPKKNLLSIPTKRATRGRTINSAKSPNKAGKKVQTPEKPVLETKTSPVKGTSRRKAACVKSPIKSPKKTSPAKIASPPPTKRVSRRKGNAPINSPKKTPPAKLALPPPVKRVSRRKGKSLIDSPNTSNKNTQVSDLVENIDKENVVTPAKRTSKRNAATTDTEIKSKKVKSPKKTHTKEQIVASPIERKATSNKPSTKKSPEKIESQKKPSPQKRVSRRKGTISEVIISTSPQKVKTHRAGRRKNVATSPNLPKQSPQKIVISPKIKKSATPRVSKRKVVIVSPLMAGKVVSSQKEAAVRKQKVSSKSSLKQPKSVEIIPPQTPEKLAPRRKRAAAASIGSMKELSGNKKLRRGDTITSPSSDSSLEKIAKKRVASKATEAKTQKSKKVSTNEQKSSSLESAESKKKIVGRSPKKTPKSKKPAKKVPTPSPPKRITRSRK